MTSSARIGADAGNGFGSAALAIHASENRAGNVIVAREKTVGLCKKIKLCAVSLFIEVNLKLGDRAFMPFPRRRYAQQSINQRVLSARNTFELFLNKLVGSPSVQS